MSEPSRLDRLTADRNRLEMAMDEADARTLPALVREHRAVLKEVEALAAPVKGSIRDQLAEKRAAREAGTPGPAASEV